MKKIAAVFSVIFLALLGCFGFSTTASATSDSIDSFKAVYNIREDGVIEVNETLVWRFGNGSGRHGINRDFIVREAWDEQHDAVFKYENMQVTSPDASAEVSTEKFDTGEREEQLRYRIGSSDKLVLTPTATYNFSYELRGALRTADGDEQLYWDILTSSVPTIENLEVRVKAPQGVQKVQCFVGSVHSHTPCHISKIEDGEAIFNQSPNLSQDIFTVAAGFKQGAVKNAEPILVENKQLQEQRKLKRFAAASGVGAVAMSIASAFVARRYLRRRRDDRFQGAAPGNIPTDFQNAPIIKDDGKALIPVFFTPPNLPVAYAGVLEDGVFNSRETTATLVSLAVRGHLQIKAEVADGGMSIRKAYSPDPVLPYEQRMLDSLFANNSGDEVQLDDYGQLESEHSRLREEVTNGLLNEGLFKKLGGRKRFGINGSTLLLFSFISIGFSGISLLDLVSNKMTLFLAVVFTPAIFAMIWVMHKTKRGTRTAVGTAFTDQVVGFRKYLATAEADQLRFEEGQDIFSQYLPWAIVFGEADRWTKVCRKLIEMGRIPNNTPYWYYGPNFYDMMYYSSWSRMASNVQKAASPEPVQSGSSGFGGGSGFSGGHSGGGGGGSSMSSW